MPKKRRARIILCLFFGIFKIVFCVF